MIRIAAMVTCGILLWNWPAEAQSRPPFEQSLAELDQTIQSVYQRHTSWQDRFVTLAKAHLGQPYALYLLGEGPFETIDPEPVWRHDQSDCVTFVEHILAYSLSENLRDAVRLLQRIRYDGGHISVLTRNHYTEADWNIHNRWLLQDITRAVGGDAVRRYPLKIDRSQFFRDRYQLDTSLPIESMEVDYIPLPAMGEAKWKLRNGDVVNFVYGQGDAKWVGHMGLVIIDDGVPSLLHSQAPRVRMESIDDAIARMTTGKGRLQGFRFLRVREDAMERLRSLDGNDTPRVTVPKGSSISFEDYLQQLPISPEAWQPPPITDCICVRDGRTNQAISFEQMMADLANADVVFLGETHVDDTTHRVEWSVYEALLTRRDSKVVLAMEMFERDVQSHLDDYLAGRIDEAAFLAAGRPWGNYREAYRPLVEAARRAGAPVVASNFPRPLSMRVMREGPAALADLGEHEDWAPRELFPNSELYWKRTDNAIRGHAGMVQAMDGDDRTYSTQSLWDNSMGESCALALDRYPGFSVLHVNGGFHSAYWDGTVRQLKQRKPKANVKTVSIVPTSHPFSERVRGAPVADYLVLTEARATNLDDGHRAVYVPRETQYQLDVPKEARPDHPVPLLIWLGTEGVTAQEGMEWCRAVVGDQVAIAVLDPPYRERQRDMSLAGRWFWIDSFPEDIGAMVNAVEGTWSYVLRHYPVDRTHVCLAGEGTGATVVAATTLLTQQMDLVSLAVEPRQYSRIKDFPLPLLEDWGTEEPPSRTLHLIGRSGDHDWWKSELQQYDSIGLTTEWHSTPDDPWLAVDQVQAALARALGIADSDKHTARAKRYLLVDSNSPRHLLWARLAARRASSADAACVAVTEPPVDSAAQPLIVAVTPDSLATAAAWPRCPGPFGGTTVLVVEEAELPKWLALEADDPLQKISRFHRLRMATSAGQERGLREVLTTLREQNRKNVLIVPARFHAGEDLMRKLEKQTDGLSDQMTIHWLPGLGGQQIRIPL